MTLWDSGRGERAAGVPRWMRLARGGEGGGDAAPEGDPCNFAALGLTRESWAGLPAEDQRSLVVRFLAALGRGTAEEIGARVDALPDGLARLAFLERESGCMVPAGDAPGGGGGDAPPPPPPPPTPPPPAPPGADPFVEGIMGGYRPVATSTTGGGASTVADPGAVRQEGAEGSRWVLVDGSAGRRGKGGAVLALVALGLLVAGTSRRGRRA